MNAKEIRDQFIKLSGRFDLETVGGADNGANWFLNAGQRYLDRKLGDMNGEDPAKNMGKLVLPIVAGDYFKSLYLCRAIAKVLLMDSTGLTTELIRESANALRLNYTISTVTRAKPEYYAPVNTRYVPNTNVSSSPSPSPSSSAGPDVDTGGLVANIVNITTTLNHNFDYNGILFLPSSDASYYLEVQGLFYSMNFDEDSDESYWSVNHPDLLILAGLYKLEVFYRNMQGARDYEDALERDIRGIDMDVVAQQAFNTTQMMG